MSDCIFCKIISGDMPTDIIYEDNDFFCFKDIKPKAPTHLLLIPKKHISTLNDIVEEEYPVMGHLFKVAKLLSEKFDLPGYRVIINVNPEGGQEVYHLHMHILGGRQMKSSFG
ncbi:MAG: histidine triad nucleotide-binding protein [Pseudomonadota bacterium]|nr:histidine triad nucleotide-binding protein [Gammaproteobacteria bacterium]MEE2683503.1 histidine triad nucleotide-binding protein [Pseudomonadota bacterium]